MQLALLNHCSWNNILGLAERCFRVILMARGAEDFGYREGPRLRNLEDMHMLAKKIKEGCCIGLIAPSFQLEGENLENYEKAKEFFLGKGYSLKEGKHIYDRWFGSAGTPQDRAEDMNAMFADPEVDAVICINGGGSSSTMLEYVDFEIIKKNPKIFMGYSDISVLNQAIWAKTGLVTFNGPLFMDFGGEKEQDEYYEAFCKRFMEGNRDLPKDENAKCIKKGKARAVTLGTNIKCSMNLLGTPYAPDLNGKLLMAEAWTIPPYECTVRFSQLKQAGILKNLKGIIVGYVYGLQAPEMTNGEELPQMEDMLAEIVKEYDFPILKYNHFGHEIVNAIIPIGTEMEMDAEKGTFEITGEFIE